MGKNFKAWNRQKIKINDNQSIILFHEREIWWTALGLNVGSEQDGKNRSFERPVLIIKKFNRELLWILPMTKAIKHNKYYIPLGPHNSSFAVLSQLKTISSKRLLRKMGKLNSDRFQIIVNETIRLLENNRTSHKGGSRRPKPL